MDEPENRRRETGPTRDASRRLVLAIGIGLLLVAGGTLLATWTTTGGDVDVRETTIKTESGLELAGTVYEPDGASADDPAPAVALFHGYTGTQGTMSSFAIELADRGYVAVTVDQPGHGDSDPPAFEDGWGGPATLEHTRSLEVVDEDRVAMAGHSMGGFASLAAADEHPDGYESIVLIGSTWGPMEGVDGVPEANETVPRNAAVLFAPYDEYSPAMWNETVPGDVNEGEKLARAFGTEPPVEPGETYGSIEDGTARTYTAPPTIHTGMHRSTTAVGDALEWIEQTIGESETGETATASPDDQRWYWASIGHAIALVGGLIVAVGTAASVWRRLGAGKTAAVGDSGVETSPPTSSPPSRSTLLGLSLVPALTIYPLYAIGTAVVPVTRLTHQDLTHGYAVWALGTVAVAGAVVRWRHGGPNWSSLEALVPVSTSDRRHAGRSLAAAAAGCLALYLLATLVDAVPGGALNAWVVGFVPLSPLRWISAAVYVLPFTAAAVGFASGLDRTLDASRSLPRALGRGLALTCGGLIVFLAVQYVPLFLGFGMPLPELGPLAITTINATGLLATATMVTIAVTRFADSPLVGGLVTGLLVTWLIVGTGPIPIAPV
ncbi:alpha/beta fold hydrolase [Natronorubrum sp. JWXQ-INN-674]|uniref:Alpha/beta fold hydrolase n=1 Tax=Natronorubrum halalkaliphilum TaxID=2691917 RepID=A0A6B0VRZ6_9EURY|nr:alpha/beta fold hydrolase [Natronorubrum halalkaliphilum]MXV64214.1 alpha/beta fold hydrolase [Natronorubrum halalkaliphilum]